MSEYLVFGETGTTISKQKTGDKMDRFQDLPSETLTSLITMETQLGLTFLIPLGAIVQLFICEVTCA